RLMGYQVTIFEAADQLGGMLRLGIPDYRLPPRILDKEIGNILRLGVEVRTGRRLGRDFTLADLEKQGFKAVFLGIGALQGLKMNIPGESDVRGLVDAVDFLRKVNLGSRKPPGNRVVIIGGGNVAIDSARAALRLGCEEVTVVYRRSREEMPAYPEEIEDAIKEGVKILYLTAPLSIGGTDGKVSRLVCVKTRLGEPDESGRRRPVPVEGSEFVIACDALIPAIGQRPDLAWVQEETPLETTPWNTLVTNPHTMQTSVPHIFAGGDVVTGPSTVIEAVAAGRRAAEAMHRYFEGQDLDQLAQDLA
ncbi:MAG: FAD-dependent oxidoreductase, partial [Desulfobacterales bacterium]|nr:FAD-dependent oxidoreductase [Desulfobacterales bacterium]